MIWQPFTAFRWSVLRELGENPLVKSGSAFMASAGYIILLSEDVRAFFAFTPKYSPQIPDTLYYWINANRWEFLFFGFLLLTIGSLLFRFACPKIVKRFSDPETYATSDARIYNLSKSPVAKTVMQLNERLENINQLGSGQFAQQHQTIFPGYTVNELSAIDLINSDICCALVNPDLVLRKEHKQAHKLSDPLESSVSVRQMSEYICNKFIQSIDEDKRQALQSQTISRLEDFCRDFEHIFDQPLSSAFGEAFRTRHFSGKKPLIQTGFTIYIDHHDRTEEYRDYVIAEAMQAEYRRANRLSLWSFLCGMNFWPGIVLIAIPTLATVFKVLSVVFS